MPSIGAGDVLCALLYGGENVATQPPLPTAVIPESAALLLAVTPGMNWQAAGDSFPRLLPLLATEGYHSPLLAGLVVSVGGLTESTMKIGRCVRFQPNPLATIELDRIHQQRGINLIYL